MVFATLLFLPFFLAAPSVTAGPSALSAVARHTLNSDCAKTAACIAFKTDIDVCNSTSIQNAATCFTCQFEAGGLTQKEAQLGLNETIERCGLEDKPVDPLTIPFNASAPTGTGTGSASAPSRTVPSPPAGSSPAAGNTGAALNVKCSSSAVFASVLVILSFAAMFV
ncbi:hypothetical protein DFH09DRAFT_1227324 [Mycena vulgaris]|nr:hypothetical protein DFH09DRAFT_1227324 [Mycena vulgaris]